MEDTQATVQLGLTEEDRKESEALLRLLSSGTPLITPKVHRLPKIPRNRSHRQRSTSPRNDYYSPSAIRRRASHANAKISAKGNVALGGRDVSYLSEGKQPRSTYNSRSSQHLLATLGYCEEPNSALPLSVGQLEATEPLANLSALEGVDVEAFATPIVVNRGRPVATNIVPANRKEVAALASWVERMQSEALSTFSSNPSELFQHTQLIYTTCLGQIVKQVTAQCAERGLLLEKVWRAYVALFEKAIETYKAEKEADDEKYVKTISQLQKRFAADLADLRRKSTEYETRAFSLSNQLQSLQDSHDKLSSRSEKLTQRNKYLQEALDTSEQRLAAAEQEIESLKKVLSGSFEDYKAGVPGSKQMLQTVARALSHKSDAMKLAEDVFKHELTEFMQSEEYEEIAPFKDNETQTEVEVVENCAQTVSEEFVEPLVTVETEVEEGVVGNWLQGDDTNAGNAGQQLEDCGEDLLWTAANESISAIIQQISMGRKVHPASISPSAQECNFAIVRLQEYRSAERLAKSNEIAHLTRELTVLGEANLALTDEVAALKQELQTLRDSLANMTVRKASACNDAQSSQSPKERTHRSTARRSPTRSHDFRFNRRNPVPKTSTHPSSGLLSSVLLGQGAASGFTVKSLMRHLNTVWADYVTQGKASVAIRNQAFVSYLYDWHLMKYGLKKVAEAKMFQVLHSVQRFKSHYPRIYLYGRICGLYESMSIEDVRFYEVLQDCLLRL